ncbi:MAG: ChaB family protein, partial [Candidatus Heimdallarchaeota archaeon]|nr:ChaB family protein [Candidatus Heimdallarchaeota archaeon]
MPIGNLPPKAASLFDKVYRAELSGECKKDKACASKRAWGAVKNAGYFKGKDGKWHKRSDIEMSMAEMSFYISKASFDKKTQEMRWSAVASDTDLDEYEERMSVGLYNDFIRRAIEKEAPPEELCTEAWCGGMPYLSLAHYSDLNGKGIVGPTNNLYVDGKTLKAQGTFANNDLGRTCFNSILKDLYSEQKSEQEKIRISIGFLDWAHYHGSIKFERKNLTDRCPMCALGIGDKMFAKGQLLHLALTRVPVNARTDILPLVEESMTTQKEDAESIAGKEKAEELDELEREKANLVGKSEAVVERAEEEAEEEVKEEEVEGEKVETPEKEEDAELEEADSPAEDVEPEAEETEVQELSKQIEQIKELILPSSEPHVLDTVFET